MSDAWPLVRGGESGATVRVSPDGTVYVKYVTTEAADELRGERDRLEWLGGRGIGCPAVVDWTEDATGARLLTSALPGVPASDLTPVEARAAWPSLVATIKALHEQPGDACPFERRLGDMLVLATEVVSSGAVEAAFLRPEQRGRAGADLLAEVETELPLRLAQEAADLVVCHGDACLPNLLVDPETLRCTGVLDLGRLGLADRHVDLSLLLAHASDGVFKDGDASWAAEAMAATYGADLVDPERLRYYLLLDPLTWHTTTFSRPSPR